MDEKQEEQELMTLVERLAAELLTRQSRSLKRLLDFNRFVQGTESEECKARRARMKITKGFVADETVIYRTNVVEGLKLYEDVFTADELSKLKNFVNELRVAGRNRELLGMTFISYNQQTTSKSEFIQFGVPVFGEIKANGTSDEFNKTYIETIPDHLQDLIEFLVQISPTTKKMRPNGCRVNFFDEGDYSHPFVKPPHLEQPISTFILSESKMAFGHMIASDNEGNCRGSLMLSLNEGSLLIMDGNSSKTAMHAMSASPNKRITITFFKVQTNM
ncbi:hypothetical protein ACP275_04G027400 [Erythranthe tilingii]